MDVFSKAVDKVNDALEKYAEDVPVLTIGMPLSDSDFFQYVNLVL